MISKIRNNYQRLDKLSPLKPMIQTMWRSLKTHVERFAMSMSCNRYNMDGVTGYFLMIMQNSLFKFLEASLHSIKDRCFIRTMEWVPIHIIT